MPRLWPVIKTVLASAPNNGKKFSEESTVIVAPLGIVSVIWPVTKLTVNSCIPADTTSPRLPSTPIL